MALHLYAGWVQDDRIALLRADDVLDRDLAAACDQANADKLSRRKRRKQCDSVDRRNLPQRFRVERLVCAPQQIDPCFARYGTSFQLGGRPARAFRPLQKVAGSGLLAPGRVKAADRSSAEGGDLYQGLCSGGERSALGHRDYEQERAQQAANQDASAFGECRAATGYRLHRQRSAIACAPPDVADTSPPPRVAGR